MEQLKIGINFIGVSALNLAIMGTISHFCIQDQHKYYVGTPGLFALAAMQGIRVARTNYYKEKAQAEGKDYKDALPRNWLTTTLNVSTLLTYLYFTGAVFANMAFHCRKFVQERNKPMLSYLEDKSNAVSFGVMDGKAKGSYPFMAQQMNYSRVFNPKNGVLIHPRFEKEFLDNANSIKNFFR